MVENVIHHPGLKRRTDLHLARKIWHVSAVFLMYLVWSFAPEKVSLASLAVCWILFVPLDFLRQFWPSQNGNEGIPPRAFPF